MLTNITDMCRNIYYQDDGTIIFKGNGDLPFVENWSVELPEFLEDFKYSSDQPELADFSKWLNEFEQTERFKSVAERYIKAQERLKHEKDPEMRHLLVRIDKQLLKEV